VLIECTVTSFKIHAREPGVGNGKMLESIGLDALFCQVRPQSLERQERFGFEPGAYQPRLAVIGLVAHGQMGDHVS